MREAKVESQLKEFKVQEFKVQEFKGSRVQGSRVQGSRVQGSREERRESRGKSLGKLGRLEELGELENE